jgi:hypothetical protein
VTFAKVVCAQTATGIDMMLNAVREPYAGKLARTVLRGPRFREGARLPTNLVRETVGDFFNSIDPQLPFDPAIPQ